MKTLVDAFAVQVERHGSKLALQDGDRSWTYSELDRAANRLAHAILERRPGTAAPVGVLLPHTAEALIAIVAVWKTGKIQLVLDTMAPPARLNEILEHAEAELVLTDQAHRDTVAGSSIEALCIDLLPEGGPDRPPWVDVGEESVAAIYYTSGSTGRPKGVFSLHGDLVRRLGRNTAARAIHPDDRVGLTFDLSFSAARGNLSRALLNGASLHLYDLRNNGPAGLAPWLLRERITTYGSVATLLRQVFQELPDGDNFPDLRLLQAGAERLLRRDVELFRAKVGSHCKITHGYGSSEGSSIANLCVTDVDLTDPVAPVGPLTPGVDVRIIDPDEHGVGEIEVRADSLAAGYWREPELTAAAFRVDDTDPRFRIFRTGDFGRMRDDGMLELHGRRDARVKLRGFTVDLSEIERVLLRAAPVREAIVVVDRADTPRPRLVAHVVLEPGVSASAPTIRRMVTRVLPDYMTPAAFVVLDEMPLTSHGKIDRRALPVPDNGRPDLDVPFVTPRDELETTIAAVWEKVLDAHPVGVHDEFLDLGGDSLGAAELITMVGDAVGKELPFSIVLRASTVAQLADLVRDGSNQYSAIVPLQTEGSRPPVFCVHGGEGEVLNFRPLAERLGDDQPFYGLQMTRDDDRRSLRTVGDFAAHYLEAIRDIPIAPPFVVGGYSAGGHVAFEMAQQVAAAGFDPPVVFLIDTPAAGVRGGTKAERQERMFEFLDREVPKSAAGSAYWAVRGKAFQVLMAGYATTGVRVPGRWRKVFRLYLNGRAMARYRPRPYPGPIVLLRAMEQRSTGRPRDLGWARYAGGGLSVIDVPGGHRTMVRWPFVDGLARALRDALDNDSYSAPAAALTSSENGMRGTSDHSRSRS